MIPTLMEQIPIIEKCFQLVDWHKCDAFLDDVKVCICANDKKRLTFVSSQSRLYTRQRPPGEHKDSFQRGSLSLLPIFLIKYWIRFTCTELLYIELRVIHHNNMAVELSLVKKIFNIQYSYSSRMGRPCIIVVHPKDS